MSELSSASESIDLSLVIPLLNEERNVPELYPKLIEVLEPLGRTFEIIFVDDGSTDRTFHILKDLHEKDPRVKAVRFTTNFGKSAGYAAGFDMSRGDVVITMDGDLQDDPQDIPRMLKKIEEGYDLVVGWKTEGKDRVAGKSLPSFIFNRVSIKLTGLRIHDMNCPFKAYRRPVAKAMARDMHGELFRYQPLMSRQRGFTIAEEKVANLPRVHGTTKYGFSKFLRGFLDLLTVIFLTRWTQRPLHLFGTVGMLSGAVGALVILVLYINKFITGTPIGHYLPLFLISILLVIFGMQSFSIGLVSEMIAQKDQDPSNKYTVKEILDEPRSGA